MPHPRLAERHPGSSVPHILFFDFCRRLCALYFRLFHAPIIRNIARVPDTGPVLIIANHQSFLDPPLVGCFIDRRHCDFIARAGLFKVPGFGRLLHQINCVPIAEQGGDTAAMKETLRRLAMGRCVVLFPEGTRSPDGAMHEFKRGVAVILKRANCPVIPAAVEGVFDAWPRHSKAPRVFTTRVGVAYGEPIPPADLLKDGPDAAITRLWNDVEHLRQGLHAEIRRATGGRLPRSPAVSPAGEAAGASP